MEEKKELAYYTQADMKAKISALHFVEPTTTQYHLHYTHEQAAEITHAGRLMLLEIVKHIQNDPYPKINISGK